MKNVTQDKLGNIIQFEFSVLVEAGTYSYAGFMLYCCL